MIRPIYAPMPRHANRYFEQQLQQTVAAPPTSRRPGPLSRLFSNLLLAAIAVALWIFVVLMAVKQYFAERFEWRHADRAILFGLKFFTFVALFYIVWVVMTAWATGAFDRLVTR